MNSYINSECVQSKLALIEESHSLGLFMCKSNGTWVLGGYLGFCFFFPTKIRYPFILYTPALIWLIPVQIACCDLADSYTAFQSLGHRSLFSFTILGVLITHLITSLGNSRHGVRNCTANYLVEHAYHITGTLFY